MTGHDYDTPPVVETVVGIEFSALADFGFMSLARVHDLWSDGFPIAQEQEALPPTRPVGQNPGFTFQFGIGATTPRLWSLSEDQHLLVQVQHDRLLLNWRKLDTDSPYPRFAYLVDRYRDLLSKFSSHVSPSHGDLAPLVTEWTYVNRIDADSLQGGSHFEVWTDPHLEIDSHPLMTSFHHIRSFNADGASGQLELSAQPAGFETPAPVQLSISAKCFHQPGTSIDSAFARIDTAHGVAKAAFDAMTTEAAKESWGVSR